MDSKSFIENDFNYRDALLSQYWYNFQYHNHRLTLASSPTTTITTMINFCYIPRLNFIYVNCLIENLN